MANDVRIALDAMGGDHGPGVIAPGAAMALRRNPALRFLMFGDEAAVRPAVEAHPELAARTTIIHAPVSIRMDDKPSQALRKGRRSSSMWMAIEAVKKGEADAAVSAGNTGALMAMAKICLRTMATVDRPALAARWPTARGQSVVLDLGASIGADAQHLVDLAIMGAALARILLGVERPSVGLLNVGVEEIKGIEEVKAAGRILREADFPHMNYLGFVEGDDLGKGTADVVVAEGFTGNIALKTAEGTAKLISGFLKEAMNSTLMSRIGYLFAKGAFDSLKERMDPRRFNGAVFLGLEGIVIKSHGGADALGFSGAIDIAHEMARQQLLAKISEMIAQSQDRRETAIESEAAASAAGGSQ
ncbi:MAG: phosphate acyltransferase PlsX [Beijerinckiaceae bacterium]|nr:phosphate acyltransferase PlsX [Beijerinckiaceae bacterium]